MRARWVVVFAAVLLLASRIHAQIPLEDFPVGRDVYVDAFIQGDNRIYVGEQIVYVFRYYTRFVTAELYENWPAFEGFWLVNRFRGIALRRETIHGDVYNVGELQAVIAPTRAGTLEIAPMGLEIAETVFRESQVVESRPVNVEVLPLPEGAPDVFDGAVGQFDMQVMLGQTAVGLGEPLMLTLTLSGVGNIEQLPAPSLNLPDSWRAFAQPSQIRGGDAFGLLLVEKVFGWLLVPGEAGTHVLPPVEFAYFEPDSAEYRVLSGPSFTVEVSPGAEGERQAQFAAADTTGPEALPLKPVSLNNGTGPGWWFWLLWLVPPGLMLAVWGRAFVLKRLRLQRIHRRQSRALSKAMHQLESARETPPREAFATIEAALYGYIWDKLGYIPGDLGYRALEAALGEHGVDAEAVGLLAACLLAAESGRYMPDRIEDDATRLVERSRAVLSRLEKRWQV